MFELRFRLRCSCATLCALATPSQRMASAALSGGGFVTAPPQSVGDELPAASQSTLLLQKKKEMAEV